MPIKLRWALGAAAIVAAVLVVRSYVGARDAEWQTRVETEMARAEAALVEADIANGRATSFSALADSAFMEAMRKDTVIVRMIEELPAPPADCEPFTAPRDSVIVGLQDINADLESAVEAERSATDQLRIAEGLARRSADSLLAVLGDRPQPLSPLIPKIGLGATAGICTTGQPCVAMGLTLSWEVNLF